MKILKIVSSIAMLALVLACNPKSAVVPAAYEEAGSETAALPPLEQPKNIILMIGDGMGLTQISAGMYSNGNKLHLERCPIIGLHKPYASDNLVTDSAAGATAFSCGKKTYNGAIGVDETGSPIITILEEAESRQLATGLVTSSTIVHATPAAFIAHVKDRQQYEDIAKAFLTTEIDYFVGGGKKYFDRREDDKDLLAALKSKGYQIATYFEKELQDVPVDYSKNFGYLTADGDPLTVEQGRTYLPGASATACKFLEHHSYERGFFLMIEGAQIDWGGHANNSQYIIREMLDFDQTVGAVLDFAQQDGKTLVIITADHETGGYAINPGSSQDTIVASFTTKGHTGVLIPVFAFGPGAELFSGIYENTAIYHKMRAAYGWKESGTGNK